MLQSALLSTNNEPTTLVNVGQFVTALIEHSFIKPDTKDYMNYGYQAGWLEDLDLTGKDTPILRKNAARIIHEFMRLELQKPDTDDVFCANMLRDLYDCRVCTKHVMQVYAKGIMEGYYVSDTLYLFGMNEPITCVEMDEIISRIF